MTELAELFTVARSQRAPVLYDFDPWDYQAELLDFAEENEIAQAAVKPGRQVGKTVTGGLIAADEFVKSNDVMILAPYEDTVREMMDEAKNFIETLRQKAQANGETFAITTDNELEYESAAGGRLRARTVGTTGTQIRGKNPSVVLVDEAAYIKDKIFTEVIEPFFSTHNSWQFYLFSTPAGKSGYFYDCVEGQYSDEWFSPHWPSEISPQIDAEFLEKKRTQLDSFTYRQEYLGEFVDEADSYLPHEIVSPCVAPDAKFSRTEPRWLGVDPAERGRDEMVILDIGKSGYVHNIWSRQTVTGPDFVGLLTDLHTSRTLPEPKIGHGDPPKNGYEEIIVESNMAGLATDILEAGIGNVVTPVKSTTKSKGPMYKRLKRDLEAQELTLPNYRKLTSQLTSLQYSYTANKHLKLSHPPNGHDDYPDALMLANAGRTGVAQEYATQMEGAQTKASATFGW